MQFLNLPHSLLVATFCSIAAAGNGVDPVKNYCRRWYHQSQYKNGMLFIDGGLESFSDQGSVTGGSTPDWIGNITTGLNQAIIAINMTTSWNWKTNISEVVINKTAVAATGNPVPEVQSAALFRGAPDDSQIYLYGGVTPSINTSFPDWQAPLTNQYTLWGFNIESHSWTQYDVFENAPQRPSWGASAEVADLGLAFYLNGIITNYSSLNNGGLKSDVLPLIGLVVIDLNNQTAQNISTMNSLEENPVLRGGMVYVPGIGAKGVLVTVGGASCSAGSNSCDDKNLTLQSMSDIDIFDIASLNGSSVPSTNRGWFNQTTTGTPPEPRVDFCVVVVSAPDGSSHNIYMYGGWDPTSGTVYDEIWVLTIPSFTWIKTYSGSAPRFGHTCNMVGNDQMITIGGLDSPNVTDSCDWEYMSVAIYNLTGDNSNSWGSVYTANATKYGVSQAIFSVIGGSPSGKATKLLPGSGWSNSEVADLFTGTTNKSQPVVISAMATGTSSVSSAGSKTSKEVSVGVIAGVVVGSVVAVALIGTGLFYFRLRKMKKEAEEKIEEERTKAGSSDKPEYIKPELDTHEAHPQSPRYELGEQQYVSEIDGNQRYETVAEQLPVEMEGSEVKKRFSWEE